MDLAIDCIELMPKFATIVADAKGRLTTKRKWIERIPSTLKLRLMRRRFNSALWREKLYKNLINHIAINYIILTFSVF